MATRSYGARAAHAAWRALPPAVMGPLRRVRRSLAAALIGGELDRLRWEAQRALDQSISDLMGRQDTVLASYDQRVASLANRVLDLEEYQGGRPTSADGDANQVLQSHSGSRSPMLDLRRVAGLDGRSPVRPEDDVHVLDLADLVRGLTPVLDLASRDGRLLRILQHAGVTASGVEADPVAAARLRQEGFDVTTGDLLVELAGRAQESLGAIVADHVAEHLDVPDIARLLVAARRALRPDGRLVLESTFPERERSLIDFWRDPTRLRPYDPDALAGLAERAGLRVVSTKRRDPNQEDYRIVCAP
ncbi:MAG TPA: class I SAM-dependent methyltransferase [Acidimicrobiales bacterium]